MKNKEKYTNIDEALNEYNFQLNAVRSIGKSVTITFEQWLEKETFEDTLKNEIKSAIDYIKKLLDKTNSKDNLTCPICGSKNTTVDTFIFPTLDCDDCGATICFKKGRRPIMESKEKFIGRLTNKGKL